MKSDYEIYGTGKPIVFLHAFPLTNKMWRGNINNLTDKGFQVILPNLYFEPESENAFSKTAEDIAELIGSLHIKRAIFAGLSMGGYVCFNLFRLHPTLFSGLILCDTNSAGDSAEKRNSRFEQIEKIKKDGNRFLVNSTLPNLISDHTKLSNKKLLEELKEMVSATDSNENISALRAMAFRRDHDEILGQINIPTMIIFGAEDKITNLEIARKLHTRISDSKLFILQNAGHLSNLEQPAQFNKIISDFAESVIY